MSELTPNRKVSGAVAHTQKTLHVSMEQAALSAAATSLGGAGRLLLPNGQSLSASDLRVVGAAPDAKKQAALDTLLVAKGYSAGAIKLNDFALFCDDISEQKAAKGSSFALPDALLKAGLYGTEPTAPALQKASPTVVSLVAPKAKSGGEAVRMGTTTLAPTLQLNPPSDATKAAALELLSQGKLSPQDQKKLVALASTMIPAAFADDSRAPARALTALFHVLKPNVDAQDAADAGRDIAQNVVTARFVKIEEGYELRDGMHDEFAPQALMFQSRKPIDVSQASGAEKVVAANADDRHAQWTPNMIKGTPYAFAQALTQIDGDKVTTADQTLCGPMSMVGAIALRDPNKLPSLAKTILAHPDQFKDAQEQPFQAALTRIKAGTFSPADANLMARALYASITNDKSATSGVTPEQLASTAKILTILGFEFPTIQIDLYSPETPGAIGHFNAVVDRNFDPWPSTDGKAVIQPLADAVARHQAVGLKPSTRLVITSAGSTLSTL